MISNLYSTLSSRLCASGALDQFYYTFKFHIQITATQPDFLAIADPVERYVFPRYSFHVSTFTPQ